MIMHVVVIGASGAPDGNRMLKTLVVFIAAMPHSCLHIIWRVEKGPAMRCYFLARSNKPCMPASN